MDSSKEALRVERERYNKLESEFEKFKKDAENALDTEHKKYETLQDDFKKKVKEQIATARETIEREIEAEYNEALEEQSKELEQKIKEVDDLIGQHISEVMEKNTLYFTCSCDKNKKIPVSIDLSTENRFTCENCGSTYRVAINAYPVLLSSVTNNRVLANIFSKQ